MRRAGPPWARRLAGRGAPAPGRWAWPACSASRRPGAWARLRPAAPRLTPARRERPGLHWTACGAAHGGCMQPFGSALPSACLVRGQRWRRTQRGRGLACQPHSCCMRRKARQAQLPSEAGAPNATTGYIGTFLPHTGLPGRSVRRLHEHRGQRPAGAQTCGHTTTPIPGSTHSARCSPSGTTQLLIYRSMHIKTKAHKGECCKPSMYIQAEPAQRGARCGVQL